MKTSKKPGCWIQEDMHSKSKWREFKTYAELKKNIKNLINENDGGKTNEITIFRTRRGEWGEWFEKWSIIDGRPQIWKQGWM